MTHLRKMHCRNVRLVGAMSALVMFTLWPDQARAQMLPSGWAVSNVGAPAIPGYATYSSGTYNVSGAGTGIAGSTDQFTFLYRRITGDATIVSRVGALPVAPASAQFGLMIREGLSAGSRHGAVLVSREDGVTFKRRQSTGGETTSTPFDPGTGPVWLRVDRRSSTISVSVSGDGSTWTLLGTDTVGINNVLYVGLAVSSRTMVAPAQMGFTGVQTLSLVDYGGPLPAGWRSEDVGGPGRAGAGRYDQGSFGLQGGGTDVGGTWDQFHFAYTTIDEDVDIVARLRDLGNTNVQSKAGVMIRDSLTANGAHASVFVTSSGTTIFRTRATGGGTTVDTLGPSRQAPVWLKLSLRTGVVTASHSVDGASWTVLGTQALTLPSPFHLGLAVTSHDNASTVIANVDHVAVTVVPAPNNEPSVTLTEPLNGATYQSGAAIAVSADASDSDGTIARIDFYQGTTLIGSDTTSPYGISWTNAAPGTYSVTAVATDDDGATMTSAARTITVTAPNQPPTVALIAPADGAAFTAPATITVTATATDGDGTIGRVDFFQGTTLIGSDATSPYSVTWSNVPAGTYSLRAVATDDTGATTVSTARSITVSAATVQRNAVFSASPDHDSLVHSYLLEIFAAGANPAAATPLATQNLGKPAVVNGEIAANITSTINGLSPGSYQATVSAVGSGGSSRSDTAAFTR